MDEALDQTAQGKLKLGTRISKGTQFLHKATRLETLFSGIHEAGIQAYLG